MTYNRKAEVVEGVLRDSDKNLSLYDERYRTKCLSRNMEEKWKKN
jgi:hypothetical protein